MRQLICVVDEGLRDTGVGGGEQGWDAGGSSRQEYWVWHRGVWNRSIRGGSPPKRPWPVTCCGARNVACLCLLAACR